MPDIAGVHMASRYKSARAAVIMIMDNIITISLNNHDRITFNSIVF